MIFAKKDEILYNKKKTFRTKLIPDIDSVVNSFKNLFFSKKDDDDLNPYE